MPSLFYYGLSGKTLEKQAGEDIKARKIQRSGAGKVWEDSGGYGRPSHISGRRLSTVRMGRLEPCSCFTDNPQRVARQKHRSTNQKRGRAAGKNGEKERNRFMSITEKLEELKDAIAGGTTALRDIDTINAAIEHIEALEEKAAVIPEPALDESARALGGVIIENINIYVNEK